jgi:hypothetical protein
MNEGNHENPQESQCPGQDSSHIPKTSPNMAAAAGFLIINDFVIVTKV